MLLSLDSSVFPLMQLSATKVCLGAERWLWLPLKFEDIIARTGTGRMVDVVVVVVAVE
jgi:hypothetical protein